MSTFSPQNPLMVPAMISRETAVSSLQSSRPVSPLSGRSSLKNHSPSNSQETASMPRVSISIFIREDLCPYSVQNSVRKGREAGRAELLGQLDPLVDRHLVGMSGLNASSYVAIRKMFLSVVDIRLTDQLLDAFSISSSILCR